jgi:uncharacterized protein (TIGR00369 family)
MTTETHFRKLEQMYLAAPTNEYFEPRIVVNAGTAQVTIPVRPDFFHPGGAVHGNIIFKALDDSAFFAVNSLVDVFVLTVSFNIYFMKPISTGEMIANGRVTHRSKRFFMAESVLTDIIGTEIARGNGLFMPSQITLTPELGYK